MTKTSGELPIVWTIRGIRVAIACVAFAFPLMLLFGYVLVESPDVLDSISSYYHTNSMPYVFMGGLIGLGLLLIAYQYRDPESEAFGTWEFVISTLAGVSAIGVAVFPAKPGCPKHHPLFLQSQPACMQHPPVWVYHADVLHHISTVALFVCIAVLVLFFFSRPAGPLPWNPTWMGRRVGGQKHVRNWWYFGLGIAMIILGLVMEGQGLLATWFHWFTNPPYALVFVGETLAFIAFAAAWAIKGELFFRD
jgi:hypothetical membrane protein